MAPEWEEQKFWFTNIKDKSAMELLGGAFSYGKKAPSETTPI